MKSYNANIEKKANTSHDKAKESTGLASKFDADLYEVANKYADLLKENQQLRDERDAFKKESIELGLRINNLKSQLEKVENENQISYWDGFNDGFESSENIAPDMLDKLTQIKDDNERT